MVGFRLNLRTANTGQAPRSLIQWRRPHATGYLPSVTALCKLEGDLQLGFPVAAAVCAETYAVIVLYQVFVVAIAVAAA